MSKDNDELKREFDEEMKPKKTYRGFATMDPEKRREAASKGGAMAHKRGTAHKFTEEEAKIAGRKGGLAKHTHRGRTPVSE